MAKKHSVLTNNDLHNPKGILVHSTGSMLVMSQSISTATASFHFIPDDTDTYTLGNTARAWKELYVSTGSIHFVEKDGTVARTLEVDATGFGFGGGDVSGSTISGSKLHIVGDAFIGGDLTLGDADTDSISIGADITSNLIPNADATYDLGSSSQGWNDIHLGSGGVINLDGGDVTLTHAAGKITLGGDGAVEFDFADHEMTNVDIDGGAIDGTAIGAASHTTIKGTTIDATTDFTIGGTVITDNTITDDGTLVIASTTATSFSDGNITNVGDINADSLSVDDAAVGLDINFGGNTTLNKITLTDNLADALNINEGGNSYIKFTTSDSSEQIVVGKNSTFNGTTIADLGTVTTANIDGGTVDGTTIGASSHTTIKGTTIDATTDFTIGGTVITDNTITDDGTLVIASTTATSFSDGNITNVGDIALDTISADDGSSLSFSNNWTNAGRTVADLGIVTTVDIDGGSIDGATIGAASHTTIKGTTIDATTDFTIDGLVLTADTITNDSNLTMDLAGDLAIDVDGGDVTITDDGADLATINATKISGSSTSTGSFGALTVADGVTTTLSPISSDGAALGSISDMWSDLFLADAGVINFNNGNSTITGGSALINVNVPIRGTKLEIDSASDYLDVSTDLQIIAAADITLNPGGNNVKPGGDSEDDLGVDGTAWRKLFVDDIDLNGQGRIDLDADADTSVRASADDVITFEAGAVDITQMTATMTVSGSSISTGSFSDLMATGTGASVAASSASLVSFKDNSTSQFGYLATADSEAVTAGLVGYNASNGNLTISSIVDGGSF